MESSVADLQQNTDEFSGCIKPENFLTTYATVSCRKKL